MFTAVAAGVCANAVPVGQGDFISACSDEAAVRLGKRSGYHLFLSRNINAFGEGDRVDYAKLSFGGACLQLPDGFTCVQNEAGYLPVQSEIAIRRKSFSGCRAKQTI